VDCCVERETMEMGYLGGVAARIEGTKIINGEIKKKKKNWRGRNDNRKKEEKGFKICWEFRAITGYNNVRPLRELKTSRSV